MQAVRLRSRFTAALRLSIFVALASCCILASARTRILTDSDKGAKISLYDGDQVELRLTSNPSTGFQWSVHPDSTPLMKLDSQSNEPSKEPGVGRPSVQIFRFEAVKRGNGVLLLHYVRSWEKPQANEQQYDLHVTIK